MADNDFVDESFLKVLDRDADELEAAGRNQNCRSDEVGHANPETGHHGIQVNSSLECDRSFSASSSSPETRVAASLPTALSVQCSGPDFDTSTSDPVAGAQQSTSEATEENPTNFFLVPVETPRDDFGRTDDSQSNPSEHSSSQHNIGRSDKRPIQKKRPRNVSFGAEDGTCRKKENKRVEFFQPWKPTESNLESPPQTSKESDVNEVLAQTAEDYRELSSSSSIFPQIDGISSIEMATEGASLGAVVGAEADSAGGPSGIQTQTCETGTETLFVCDFCGKAFARKDYLEKHDRTHTGDKRFVCSTCGKGFAQKSTLTAHLRTHSGEKSFKCKFCSKEYADKHSRDNHQKENHGGKEQFP